MCWRGGSRVPRDETLFAWAPLILAPPTKKSVASRRLASRRVAAGSTIYSSIYFNSVIDDVYSRPRADLFSRFAPLSFGANPPFSRRSYTAVGPRARALLKLADLLQQQHADSSPHVRFYIFRETIPSSRVAASQRRSVAATIWT